MRPGNGGWDDSTAGGPAAEAAAAMAPDPEQAAWMEAAQATVNRWIDEALPADPDDRVLEAMRYALLAGGKRLRPLLALAAGEYVRIALADLRPVALALEFVHTYSLIHDDLPAMDNDDFRRGRPTVHRRFDEATAILAGDALLTEAFYVLAATGRPRAIAALAEACGFRGLIRGQMLDLLAEGQAVDAGWLERIHRHKTGALFAAAVRLPAILQQDRAAEQALEQFGVHFGLAFQIVDDILNVVGDPSLLGKPVGSDRQRGKATYPALWGLPEARRRAEAERAAARAALAGSEPERARRLYYLLDFAVARRW